MLLIQDGFQEVIRTEAGRSGQQDHIKLFDGHHFFVPVKPGEAIFFGNLEVEGFKPFAEGIDLVLEYVADGDDFEVGTCTDEVDGCPVPLFPAPTSPAFSFLPFGAPLSMGGSPSDALVASFLQEEMRAPAPITVAPARTPAPKNFLLSMFFLFSICINNY